ncbi:unnamed protein product, partial [Ilex paraguariensis]
LPLSPTFYFSRLLLPQRIVQVCLCQSNPHRQHHLTLVFQILKPPNDVEVLRSLMEIQIKNQKVHEAISIIERLIELEPSDIEWPLLRAHMHCYGGETELAESRFNEIMIKTFFVSRLITGWYYQLLRRIQTSEMKEIEKRIEEGMKMCKKDNKKDDWKDFKLLLAQIRVIEGDYKYALRIYQELAQEEPRDFRPYVSGDNIYFVEEER